jgi:hypothetical protein
MALTEIPNLPPYSVDPGDLQVWWQLVKTAIEGVLADQQGQIDTINAIIDPNTLTPDKKPIWIFMETYLTGEQSDIDAKATSYGITTEKTAYDNAISALTTYLATLTTAVLWSDTSGNTTIVDTTPTPSTATTASRQAGPRPDPFSALRTPAATPPSPFPPIPANTPTFRVSR